MDLLKEMDEHIEKGNVAELKLLTTDVKQNLEKITHHGQLADAIVKGMQQHARSTGRKELTDINSLTDEYLWVCYNRLTEKDKTFEARIQTDFDKGRSSEEGKIKLIREDIGIVLLNIIGKAFYAVTEKKKQLGDAYQPIVSVTTKMIPGVEGGGCEILIRDNGIGIPAHLLTRVFQPFFTTKPAGKGTGLGLSLSYDIITKGHGGQLKFNTMENEYSEFIIYLPPNN